MKVYCNMKALFLFLLGFLVGACASVARPEPSAAPVPARVSGVSAADLAAKTVALVHVDLDDGETDPFCTGVWVGRDTVLTAAHCAAKLKLGDPVEYVVRSDVFQGSSGEAKPSGVRIARLYALDSDHDLALLYAPEAPSHPIARLAPEPPEQGQRAYGMGHAMGQWYSFSSGDVGAVRKTELGLDMYWVQATVPTNPGNSGGGLFNEAGDLIGICSRQVNYARQQGLNFFVHPMYIGPLLRLAR